MLAYVPVHFLLDYVAIAQAVLSFQWVMLRGILAAHCWLLLNLPLIFRKRQEVQRIRTEGDEAVIRKNSPTLGQWYGEVVSAANKKIVYAPAGFARGFCVLSDAAEIAPDIITIRLSQAFCGTTRKSGSNGRLKIRFFPKKT